ncbi:hypothetical protein [Atlantibacter hermannii]|uniref:hypothetical protein n=1 Tax=Atlantibacter hermannii TaxID=565 RepID=UPI0028B18665|nr:hypothetical protein [Atlantibacter hermannii]
MTTQNTLALLNWYRSKNVAAVKTPAGIVFMGMRNITADQRETLLAITQADLQAALRIQQ